MLTNASKTLVKDTKTSKLYIFLKRQLHKFSNYFTAFGLLTSGAPLSIFLRTMLIVIYIIKLYNFLYNHLSHNVSIRERLIQEIVQFDRTNNISLFLIQIFLVY
jgi:hypothetical protein